jgi:hypothetical protein
VRASFSSLSALVRCKEEAAETAPRANDVTQETAAIPPGIAAVLSARPRPAQRLKKVPSPVRYRRKLSIEAVGIVR